MGEFRRKNNKYCGGKKGGLKGTRRRKARIMISS